MKSVCAWCNKVMKEGVEPVTHGICKSCATKVIERYEKKLLGSSSPEHKLHNLRKCSRQAGAKVKLHALKGGAFR